ncbi:hypothetical protein HK405_008289, partial [Cladochytrium tenue]
SNIPSRPAPPSTSLSMPRLAMNRHTASGLRTSKGAAAPGLVPLNAAKRDRRSIEEVLSDRQRGGPAGTGMRGNEPPAGSGRRPAAGGTGDASRGSPSEDIHRNQRVDSGRERDPRADDPGRERTRRNDDPSRRDGQTAGDQAARRRAARSPAQSGGDSRERDRAAAKDSASGHRRPGMPAPSGGDSRDGSAKNSRSDPVAKKARASGNGKDSQRGREDLGGSRRGAGRPSEAAVPAKRGVPRNAFDDPEYLEQNASSIIRQMFGYNPRRYHDSDSGESDMEADFDALAKEERRSTKIARLEDEREEKLEAERLRLKGKLK